MEEKRDRQGRKEIKARKMEKMEEKKNVAYRKKDGKERRRKGN